MKLTVQKRLAASLFKCSQSRVWFDEDRLADIKEAITKQDIKGLVTEGAIRLKPLNATSRGRARQKLRQKSKGLQRGSGSRKSGQNARVTKKQRWIGKIRIQRKFLKELRDKSIIAKSIYQNLYLKSKGGFFRSKRHIKIFIEEKGLAKAKK